MTRVLGFVAASIAAHALFYALVVSGILPADEWARPDPRPIDVEILAAPVEQELAPEPLPEAERATEPQVAATSVPRVLLPDRSPREAHDPRTVAPSTTDAVPVPPSTSDAVTIVAPDRAPANSEEERRRRWAMINPSTAATSGFDYGPGPSRRGPPAGLGTTDTGPSERELEESLGGGLRAEAMTKRHLQREPFRLQRRPDGSQAWVGPRLTGVVLPNGEVRFEDHGNASVDLATGTGTFDLTEAIMGASGQDPLRAERDYFMRHTEELRARLEAEHRSQETRRGLRLISPRLDRVWQTTSRTPESRRLRIFRLWDECAEDEPAGLEARAEMLRWIRLNLPPGSEFAYTEAELRRFNAHRESREEFQPYQ